MTLLQVETMPRPKRDDKAVKIDRRLAVKAGLIAETKGIPLAEYLSTVLAPIVERDWPKAVREVERGKLPGAPPAE